MKNSATTLKLQLGLAAGFLLTVVWGTFFYDLDRTQRDLRREAELRTVSHAQVYAEYSISTIKRIDEILTSTRNLWKGDWKNFSTAIVERQTGSSDVAFQLAAIDKDGFFAFSSLGGVNPRTDLSDREHFRVHKDANGQDNLFISKPIKGKVSGKWSIQFTRPIFRQGVFSGVLVASVSPSLFASFAQKLQMGSDSSMTLVRKSGERLARYPQGDDTYAQLLTGRPFQKTGAPLTGNYTAAGALEGTERIFGYASLPEHNITVTVSKSVETFLRPYYEHRRMVLIVAVTISILIGLLALLAFRSINAFWRIQQNMRVAKDLAEAGSTAKSQFLSNMSHEIRTPMNAILGMLGLLRKTELTVRQADYAGKAEGAARSLLGLLNEILDFSKIEAGKMTLEPLVFRTDHLLRDLSVILSANVGEKQVEVLFDIDPALPRQLVGDAMRLQQVLINLSGNAIKFTSAGEVVVSFSVVRSEAAAVTVEIAVRDTGIGIAPENQARIFSGFTQAEASTTRRFGGTGLGVAISQRLVALMGGELRLDSALGQGSRFHFCLTLPVAAERADDTPDDTPAIVPPPVSLHALVVDDNLAACKLLRRMAESFGWVVDVAHSGEQALEVLQTQAAAGVGYHAVFVDWQMPGLDGWETSRRIRGLGLNGTAPIIVMVTAHGQEMLSQRSEVDQALLDGFLVKPLTASMLFDAVVDARSDHAKVPQRDVPGGKRLAGMRLLVAEDNLNNQQVARELLEDEGALVQIANHGQEAIEAIAAADPPFDVVLMDLQMPVMDGFTATSRIRQDLGLQTLPIVAMTANAMASDREAYLAVGMNEHVGKPFDIDHLVAVLCKQAGRQEAPKNMVTAAKAPLPAGVGEAAVAAGVDISAALNRLGGNRGLYRRMLGTFVKELAAMPEQIAAHAAMGETQAASRLLHTVKGQAGTLGAMALSAEVAHGEKRFEQGHAGGDAELLVQQVSVAMTGAGPGLAALLQALQAAEAPVAAPGVVLDSDAVLKLLRTIGQHLQNADMAATDKMAELQRGYGGALGEQLQSLDEAISALDFDRALPLCNALINEMTEGQTA